MTVTLQAAAGKVDAATLGAMLAQLAGAFRYMMLASAEDRLFGDFRLAQAQALPTWPEGRAFGPASELRWRARRGRFAVCFISEGEALPAPVRHLEARETHQGRCDELAVPLWGEHDPARDVIDGQRVWHEAQIPRLLTYPVGQAPSRKNVALKVRRYWRDDNVVAFIRFVEPLLSGEAHQRLPED